MKIEKDMTNLTDNNNKPVAIGDKVEWVDIGPDGQLPVPLFIILPVRAAMRRAKRQADGKLTFGRSQKIW